MRKLLIFIMILFFNVNIVNADENTINDALLIQITNLQESINNLSKEKEAIVNNYLIQETSYKKYINELKNKIIKQNNSILNLVNTNTSLKKQYNNDILQKDILIKEKDEKNGVLSLKIQDLNHQILNKDNIYIKNIAKISNKTETKDILLIITTILLISSLFLLNRRQ